MGSLKKIASMAPVVVTWNCTVVTPIDAHFFVADREYEIMSAIEVHSVIVSGQTIDLVVCASGTTPPNGTTALASAFAADSTVNIPVTATLSATLTSRVVPKGSTLAVNVGTMTNYIGTMTVVLRPRRQNESY